MWYGSRNADDAIEQQQQGRLAALADILLETPPILQHVGAAEKAQPILQNGAAAEKARAFAGVLAELQSQDIWDHQASSDCGPAWLWQERKDASPPVVIGTASQLPVAALLHQPKTQADIASGGVHVETLPYKPFMGNLDDETIRYAHEEETLKYDDFAFADGDKLPLTPVPEDAGDATIRYEPYEISACSSSSRCRSGGHIAGATSHLMLSSMQTSTPPKIALSPASRRQKSTASTTSIPSDADNAWLVSAKRRRVETPACSATSDGTSRPRLVQKPTTSYHSKQFDASARLRVGALAHSKSALATPTKQLTLLEAWTRGA
jgi:hypothetical protein